MEATTITSEGPGAVMQAQEQEMKMAQEERKQLKVMVAIDESDGSLYALSWALDNLFRCIGIVPESSEDTGIVYIAHVQPPYQRYLFPAGPSPGLSGTAVYAPTSVMESVKKAQHDNSAAILSRALVLCKEKMIKAETLILDGDPKEMICEAVERMNISLLVIGSRGLSALKRAFLGSVSDYCAHHAKCPILIVKPPKESHSRK